jgi:hypothetical protein
MQRSVRPMPQATCRCQEINRGFSAPFGRQANGVVVGIRVEIEAVSHAPQHPLLAHILDRCQRRSLAAQLRRNRGGVSSKGRIHGSIRQSGAEHLQSIDGDDLVGSGRSSRYG